MPQKQSRQSTLQDLGPYMGMGMQLAAAMVVFGAVGWYADKAWGTTPWLMVVGLVAGAVGGMINLIRISTRGSGSK